VETKIISCFVDNAAVKTGPLWTPVGETGKRAARERASFGPDRDDT
jgi:hypothetical protein